MVLLLSFGFFGSVRQLMNATHSACRCVAADKVEKLLSIDTTRPYDPALPVEKAPYPGIRMEHVSFGYQGREAALRDVSLEIPKGKVTAWWAFPAAGSPPSLLAHAFLRLGERPHPVGGPGPGQPYPGGTAAARHLVPQTVSLYSGTIRENLRMPPPTPRRRNCWRLWAKCD